MAGLGNTDFLLTDSFYSNPLGGAVYDSDGKLIEINKAMYLRFSLSRKQDFIIEDLFDNMVLSDVLQKNLKNGDMIFCDEPVSFRVEPFFIDMAVVGYSLWLSNQEFSELERDNKLLMGQLAESRMLMRMALKNTKVAAYSFSFDRFNSCDRKHCNRCFQFYGQTNTLLDKNRFICRALSAVRKPEDRLDFFYLFNKIHDEKLSSYHVMFHLKDENGYFRKFEVSGKGMEKDKNGFPHVIIGCIAGKEEEDFDSEERKNIHDLNLLKTTFLSNMTHEIRTPLNAIIGFSDILSLEEDAESRVEYVRLIKENNSMLLDLLNDMLEMSKIESDMIVWSYEDVALKGVLHDVYEIAYVSMPESVRLIQDDCSPSVLYTDKFKLTLILKQLLKNAIHNTAKGEIHFGYKMFFPTSVQFYVTDTGCGIPHDKLGHIFDKFYQINSFGHGTGLGLAICKGLVTAMGGTIWVSSEEGKGSTFNFSLPLSTL